MQQRGQLTKSFCESCFDNDQVLYKCPVCHKELCQYCDVRLHRYNTCDECAIEERLSDHIHPFFDDIQLDWDVDQHVYLVSKYGLNKCNHCSMMLCPDCIELHNKQFY